jgi:tight adherence protein B
MSALYSSPFFLTIIIGGCVFGISYLMSDRILDLLYKKTVGQREELYGLMDAMFVEADRGKITISLYLVSFGLGTVVFLVLWPNVLIGLALGIAFAIGGWSGPKNILKIMWEKRCNRVVQQMVDGLTIMANGVKAGLTVGQSMDRVIENMNGPLVQEFRIIQNRIRLGSSLEEALNEFGDRIPRPDVQMFVTGVNILNETGGKLAETFQTIVTTIRERQKVEQRIDAMTSQGVMQATVISLAPFGILIFTMIADPNFIMPLFTKPLGWFALALMLGLIVIGGVLMKKIVTIKV